MPLSPVRSSAATRSAASLGAELDEYAQGGGSLAEARVEIDSMRRQLVLSQQEIDRLRGELDLAQLHGSSSEEQQQQGACCSGKCAIM
jgi:hypothetical protein